MIPERLQPISTKLEPIILNMVGNVSTAHMSMMPKDMQLMHFRMMDAMRVGRNKCS